MTTNEALAALMTDVGFDPVSATIYGSVATGLDDDDSDLDLLCVVAELPSENESAISRPVNISWATLADARRRSQDPADPIAAAVEFGLRVAGVPLPELLPDAAKYDEGAAAERAHARAAETVDTLRAKNLALAPGSALAEALAAAANAALLHHGKGRFKVEGARLAQTSERLATVLGQQGAGRVMELHQSLRFMIERPAGDVATEVQALVESLLEKAMDQDAPGPTRLN